VKDHTRAQTDWWQLLETGSNFAAGCTSPVNAADTLMWVAFQSHEASNKC